MAAAAYGFCFLFGAVVFSFLNVAISRVPKGESVAKGRSMCGDCGHVLGAGDLVPVLSYVLLRGKCRYCGAKLPLREPLLEALGGLVACACLARFGVHAAGLVLPGIASLAAFALLCTLHIVAFVDADTMEIPNGFLIAMLGAAALCFAAFPAVSLLARLIGAVCVSVPMLLLALLVQDAFGGGDIKLMAVAGLALGWQLTLAGFFAAVLAGGGYAGYLMIKKKKARGAKMPLGPFLCAGLALALFFGDAAIGWYLGLLL